MRRFCYSNRWNDHNAYPRGLVEYPPPGWHYRATSVHFDRNLGRPWSWFDVLPGEIIHASSLIPLNDNPWIMDTDHIEYLIQQAEYYRAESGVGFLREDVERQIAESIASENCLAVIAWSNACKRSIEELCSRHRVPPPTIHTVYPGVVPPDPSPLLAASSCVHSLLKSAQPDAPKLLVVDGQIGVCHNIGRKNIAAGMSCFRELRQNGVTVNMIVVGPTEDVAATEGVLVTDRLSREELWALYHHCDILLFLSRQESFGYVIFEAMYNSLCCVCASGASSPAISEMATHNETAVMIPFRNSQIYPAWSSELDLNCLHASVLHLIHDPSSRDTLAKNAKRKFDDDGIFSLTTRNSVLSGILI